MIDDCREAKQKSGVRPLGALSTLSLALLMFLAGIPACGQYNDIAARALEDVARKAKQAGLQGRIESYVSKMDGKRHKYVVCATSLSGAAKPLLVEVDGAPSEPGPGAILKAEEYAWYAKKNGQECVVVHPTGRGPGSIYQNYGEVDAFEVIEDVATKYPIDRDRISVTGSSVGGAATWYLVSHYPDFFSAGAPMAAYCDYRLWEKPGGYTFPMQEWSSQLVTSVMKRLLRDEPQERTQPLGAFEQFARQDSLQLGTHLGAGDHSRRMDWTAALPPSFRCSHFTLPRQTRL
jgi:hypothetical protein